MNTMNNRLNALAICLAMFCWPATATTISFDDLAEGTTLSNQYSAIGVLFAPNAIVGNDWATNTDMTITSFDIGDLGTPLLVLGNVLHSLSGWYDEDGNPSFSVSFLNAVNSFSLDFASVEHGSDVLILVYNGDTLLTTLVGPTALNETRQFTLGYADPFITRLVVAPGSFDDWVAVDNLVYSTVAVQPPPAPPDRPIPEPDAWLLVGLGLVTIAANRKVGTKKPTRRVRVSG